MHPGPASAGNPAHGQKDNSEEEQYAPGLTPVKSNTGHHDQASKRVPSRQAEAQFLQTIEQKDAEIRNLQVRYTQTVQQYETQVEHIHTEAIKQKDVCIVQLRQDNTDLEKSLTELSGECSRLRSVALTAQEGALKAMKKGGWAAKEDRVVRDELGILQDRLRSWAKKYSRTTLDSDFESVSARQKVQVVKELNGYCVQTNWHALLEQMPISSNKVPSVFIQALLAKDIFQHIIADPFFAFPDAIDDPELPNWAEMRCLYRTMIQCKPPVLNGKRRLPLTNDFIVNNAEAQLWRSQTIRLLSTSRTNSSDKGSSMPHRLRRMASSFVEDFINGPAQIFLPEPENQAGVTRRSDDLHSLYHQAAELALSLWAQRTSIACYGQQHLHEFNSSSPFMTAHRLQHLDEDDTRLDGRKILMCIQPAVLAFGNEDGEDYDKSKVWAKAVVLLEGDA